MDEAEGFGSVGFDLLRWVEHQLGLILLEELSREIWVSFDADFDLELRIELLERFEFLKQRRQGLRQSIRHLQFLGVSCHIDLEVLLQRVTCLLQRLQDLWEILQEALLTLEFSLLLLHRLLGRV